MIPPKGFTVEKADELTVALLPTTLDAKTTAGDAKIDSTSLTFTLKGIEGKGIPPGSYKVVVTCQPYMGTPGVENRKKLMDKAFDPFSATKSQLTVDIGKEPETQTITIDLANKSVTK